MLAFLFLLAALLLFGAGAFASTRKRLSGDLHKEGPARIADALKHRNRLWLYVLLAVVVVIALIEVFLAPLHDALVDLQYDLGGSDFGTMDTAMGGLSWLLYLGVIVGAVVGVVGGTLGGLRGYPIAESIGASDIL